MTSLTSFRYDQIRSVLNACFPMLRASIQEELGISHLDRTTHPVA